MTKNIKELIYWGKNYLKKKGIESYALDTELILSYVIGEERSYLYAHPERVPDVKKQQLFKNVMVKRGKRNPVAYILGSKEFFGIDLHVEPGVFCPRPETEVLVEEVIQAFHKREAFHKKIRIYEIGLGTGAISVSLAIHLPHAEILGCDISPKALAVTKKNLNKYNLKNRIKIFKGSLYEGLKEGTKFDCIVSNPPYLSRKDYHEAESEVRKEPKRALMAKHSGLFIIKKILREAPVYLKAGGRIFLELGHGQGVEVFEYARKQGFTGEIIADLAFKERVYSGIYNREI